MNEQARKIVHLVFGVAIAAAIFLLPRDSAVTLLAAGLLGGFVLVELVRSGWHVPLVSFLLARLEREGEFPGKGAITFTVSSLFCAAAFPAPVAASGVLTLAVLDSVSALAGMRWGRYRVNGKKTAEGFLAGVCLNTLALLVFLDPGRAFLASLCAGVVEVLGPLDDNLLIPPAVSLILVLTGV
ncbi:MAG: phosphatidate cytidylyltransferase [Methanolinea sp.]|nr:phosphatidate cytidylyltransferase [Methanolinea sp.]